MGIESQKGTKMIGFWPYNGTVVPAHRCYITEATYRRLTETSSTATSSGAKGATFYFVENVETTGINSVGSTEKAVGHWYSIDGKKLRGKPTAKGHGASVLQAERYFYFPFPHFTQKPGTIFGRYSSIWDSEKEGFMI